MEENEQDIDLFDRLRVELDEVVHQISILSNEKLEKTTFVAEDFSKLLDLMRGTISAAGITLDFLNQIMKAAEEDISDPLDGDPAEQMSDTDEDEDVVTAEPLLKLEVLEDKEVEFEGEHENVETENNFHAGDEEFNTDYDDQEQEQDLDDETLVVKKKRCFYCEACKKYFQSNSHLKRHLMFHTGERPYPCELCTRSFTTKSHLKRHHLTHTGEKMHGCELCTKSFASKGDLKTHQMVHTGVRPHSCDICGRSFSFKGNLNKHKQKLHNIFGTVENNVT